MSKHIKGEAESSEGDIRRVSNDPQLTAEGIGGLGEIYTPSEDGALGSSEGSEEDTPEMTQPPTANGMQMPGQDVWDPDNAGYHAIASRG